MADTGDKETFLRRWSRLKRAGEETPTPVPTSAPEPAAGPQTAPAADLAATDKLDFSSDFTAFLQPKVGETVKRAALKKLFHSPHFNQMDGLDVYIDDYNQFDPIPEDMLRQLTHARDMLFGEKTEDEAPVTASLERLPGQPDAEQVAGAPVVAPAQSAENLTTAKEDMPQETTIAETQKNS